MQKGLRGVRKMRFPADSLTLACADLGLLVLVRIERLTRIAESQLGFVVGWVLVVACWVLLLWTLIHVVDDLFRRNTRGHAIVALVISVMIGWCLLSFEYVI